MSNIVHVLVIFCFLISQVPLSVRSQCSQPNGRFAAGRQCDAYTECRDGVATDQLCPDGLVFNDQITRLDRYPCHYPVDVDCGSRTELQPANPTEHCAHQFGLYRHEDKRNCGQFWNCAHGKAYLFDCPEGLAFSTLTMRCEWPDETPDCNPEEFLGFRCPPPDPVQMEAFLNQPRHPHPSDCRKFYVCIDGTKPRLLTCQEGSVYNANIHTCDEPANVPGCSI